MPYSTKQTHLLQAIKHGFRPRRAMRNVSAGEAAKMLLHAKRKS